MIRIDKKRRTVTVDGIDLGLTLSEFAIACYLGTGNSFTEAELCDLLDVNVGLAKWHVCNMRKKGLVILTGRTGYYFDDSLEVIDREANDITHPVTGFVYLDQHRHRRRGYTRRIADAVRTGT